MSRLPDSRRRFFGASLLAILVVLAVLWALRKVPPTSPEQRKADAGVEK